ncbi:flavin reductase [Microvirga vignae]|uniref:Flavin reductase n=1 Tax=Microvirga vignae TaxID=1225564 RepID=A0A0H1RD46_9HYPH|nr:flavin reductase family protein [Microvirga vignae]KLK92989.1 flavin reductase [Microvirga vignae]
MTTTIHSASLPPIDVKTFWQTLAERVSGMTIVTAHGDDGPAGPLGLSAARVTANPPTILVSVDQKTTALGAILSRRHFAVNYLPAGAEAVADAFSGKAGISGADRFIEGQWDTLVTGAPVFKKALGTFDCVVDDVIQRGDISIVIGIAVASRVDSSRPPLVFFRGAIRGDLGG